MGIFKPVPIHLLYDQMIERISSRTYEPTFPFGIVELDELTLGLPLGELTVIAARPSEGKTSFGMQTALKNSQLGKDVVYITREDSSIKVLEKMCCNIFGIPNTELRKGDIERLQSRTPKNVLEHFNLLLLDDYGGCFEDLEEMLFGKENEHHGLEPMPHIIFIDYIQLIRSRNTHLKRREVVDDFMRKCKELCNRTQVTIVILSQINRSARNERPNLWQMKESGAIEESADLCLLLHYPWKYDIMAGKTDDESIHDKSMIECIIAKQKEGEIGIIKTKFTGCYYRFEDWVEEEHYNFGNVPDWRK